MADKTMFPAARQIGQSRDVIEFSFTGNGGSAVTAVQNASNYLTAASITYSATGQYNIVLASGCNYNSVVFADAVLEDAATEDGSYCTIGNFTQEGTSNPLAFQINCWAAGGSATTTTRRIFVRIVVRNTASSSSSGGTP